MSRAKHMQTNFTAGELSPLLAGRKDLSRYFNGAGSVENCIIIPTGGAVRRTGFRYIEETKSSGIARLMPFKFSTEQAYILEMGNKYMRVFKEGEAVYSPDAYTKLLLHMNGLDGSVVFTDNGVTGHVVTAVGDVQIDTSQFDMGTASGLFDGVGDYLTALDHANWNLGTDDFTIDLRVRFDALPADGSGLTFVAQYADVQNRAQFYIGNSGGVYSLYFIVVDTNVIVINISKTWTGVTTGVWYHVALIRGWGGTANNHALTVDGTILGTATVDASGWQDIGAVLEVGGANAGTNILEGRINELRISKGVARWESNFTPHTIQYPNAGPGGGLGSVYELATPYLSGHLDGLKFVQSADTIYITHPSYPPYKLVRLDHDDWEIIEVPWRPPPSVERPVPPAVTCTPAAVTGTGINFTAGAAYWLAGDVGRSITYGLSRAIITTYTNNTVVVCDIIVDFPDVNPIAAGAWDLVGSPSGSLTPSGDKQGAIITVTAAADAWRSSDVDKHILLHGGSVHITSYTNATVVRGEVMYPLSSVVATTIFSLEENAWASAIGYPRAVGFFDQRLGLAGTYEYPQDIWGSVVDRYEDMSPGPNDDQAIYYRLPRYNVILWMETIRDVLLGTAGGIMKIGSRSPDEPITPTNVFAVKESGYGSADIQPVLTGDTVLYVERLGRRVREFRYAFEAGENGGYASQDMNAIAEHVTGDGIVAMVYQQSPYSTIWCLRADGVLAGLTYLREHEVVAWHRHITDGTFESIAVIPGDFDDELWAIVNRTIDGSTVRYIERLDPPFVPDAVIDDEGNTNHKITNYGVDLVRDVKKFGDYGLKFNGATDFLSIPDHANWDIQTNFSIDLWVKHTDHVGDEEYLNQYENAANQWFLYHSHGSGLSFGMSGAGIVDWTMSGAGEITDTGWHHVVVVKVGNNWGLYIDGTQVLYKDTPDIDAYAGDLYIGIRGDSGAPFDGHMDEVRICHSNPFSAAPVVGLTDTIIVPTGPHSSDANTKLLIRASLIGTTDAFFVDSGYTYSGPPITTITGLDHLEGEAVSVLADGLIITGHVVSGNEITLATAASKVHVGLPYNSNIEPMRLGSTEPGQISRISQLRLRLDRSGHKIKMGPTSSELEDVTLSSSGLFTGDKEIDFPGAFDEDGYTYVRQDKPLPLTLLAMMYELEITRE